MLRCTSSVARTFPLTWMGSLTTSWGRSTGSAEGEGCSTKLALHNQGVSHSDKAYDLTSYFGCSLLYAQHTTGGV